MIADIKNRFLDGKTFIDLFAGIGSFRFALESFGAKCVFSSELDPHCQDVYEQNHGDRPAGDITKISENDIPPHDVICGGFPCQAFSINGDQKGFEDDRGKLFFEICRIAAKHKPWLLFLENVGNLEGHDGGKTIAVIKATLEGLGYSVDYAVLNSSNFGVPQSRKRIYILATRGLTPIFPAPLNIPVFLRDILLPPAEVTKYEIDVKSLEGFELCHNRVKPQLAPVRVGKIQGGRQGERIYHPNGHTITLSSGGGGIGAKTGLYHVGGVVRRLAPRECARLTGLPDSFVMHKSDSQCYRQFGNALVVDVVQRILANLCDGLYSI